MISVSQFVSSATLTVAQSQSSTFMLAFAAGIQNAVPGVTISVTSVTAARRRLLASVVVGYIASTTTISTSALTTSLSSPTTLAAVSASLVAAGYAGISVSSPVFSTTGSGSTATATASTSGTSPGVIAGATLGVLIPVLIGMAFLVVYFVKPQLLRCNKVGRAKGTVSIDAVPIGTTVSQTATMATGEGAGMRRDIIGLSPPDLQPHTDITAATDAHLGAVQYEEEDGALQQNTSVLDLENIYLVFKAPFDIANDMYHNIMDSMPQRDITSEQGGDVLPFVLPNPRRPSVEYVRGEGVGTRQTQTQTQTQGQELRSSQKQELGLSQKQELEHGQGYDQSNVSPYPSDPMQSNTTSPMFRKPRNASSEREYPSFHPNDTAGLQVYTDMEYEEDAGIMKRASSSDTTQPNTPYTPFSPMAAWSPMAPPVPPPSATSQTFNIPRSPMSPPVISTPSIGLFTPYRYLTSIQGDVDPIPRPSSPRKSQKGNGEPQMFNTESQMSLVESQKSLVQSQKSHAESQKSLVESQKSHVESQKSHVQSQKSHVESQKSLNTSMRSERSNDPNNDELPKSFI